MSSRRPMRQRLRAVGSGGSQRLVRGSWCCLLLAALVASAGSAVASEAGGGGGTDQCSEATGVCSFGGAATAVAPDVVAPAPRDTLRFFWGVGCPHCEEARGYLERLKTQRPGLVVEAIEVRNDPVGRQLFIDTMRRLNAPAEGVPTFVLGERYLVGFSGAASEAKLAQWIDGASEAPGPQRAAPGDEVQTKWFGPLSASKLGLPLFTLALGLIDGFNPCAMWVLVFLLAMLAGQRDRARMAVTGATFVIASGVVYFSFMAAWLSLFLVMGMTRPMQLVLGTVALGIGGLNLKDFVAFQRGPSLSIPDAAKPGIYARVRRVLNEHRLGASLLGVAVLAVLVNFVELLCTAGLPAIYTGVLARHQLSTWERLGYIGLYNLAYVFDDAAMVTIAVVTLSRRRLAEATGRWLKLVSGTVMLALGLLLLLRPEWLP